MLKEAKDREEIERILKANDLFQVLSIHTECKDENIIFTAYASIAPKVFPLTNKQPQALDAFKRVTTALLTLIDENTRSEYLEKLQESDENYLKEIENDNDEVDPFQIYYTHFPEAKPSTSIWRIIKTTLYICLILHATLNISVISVVKSIIWMHPLNTQNVQEVISFEPIPDSLPHQTDKGIQIYLPLKWCEEMFEYFLFRQKYFLVDINPIANKIWANQLEEKCEMEKVALKGKTGPKCQEYHDFTI